MAIPKFEDFLYPILLQLMDKSGTFTLGTREFVNKATSKIALINGIPLLNNDRV